VFSCGRRRSCYPTKSVKSLKETQSTDARVTISNTAAVIQTFAACINDINEWPCASRLQFNPTVKSYGCALVSTSISLISQPCYASQSCHSAHNPKSSLRISLCYQNTSRNGFLSSNAVMSIVQSPMPGTPVILWPGI